MNQQIHEQLSALMDGELERDQTRFLLKRVATDADLALRWTRYHVVRQTLRRQEMGTLRAGFAEAVLDRLQHEPLAHSPAAMPVWLRWGAGGAIAASVAVAALLVTRPAEEAMWGAGSLAGTAVQGAAANTAPIAAATAPGGEFRAPLLPVNAPVETAPASFGSDLAQPVAIDPHLQSYLLRHYQAVGGAGQSAFVPYVLLGTPQREPVRPPAGDAAARDR